MYACNFVFHPSDLQIGKYIYWIGNLIIHLIKQVILLLLTSIFIPSGVDAAVACILRPDNISKVFAIIIIPPPAKCGLYFFMVIVIS